MVELARRERLESRFKQVFSGAEAVRLLTAPGRVNLIGEHTDYNGYPVLPIAVQKNICILFRPNDGARVKVCDVQESFGEREFSATDRIEPYPTGDWGNYVKAGVQALTERFGPLKGFDGVFSGNIPADAGLSSSSAMVVASALALIHSNQLSVDPLELMDLLAVGEHYVGTQGGGMDQAICLGGEPQHALKIDFFPLRVEPVPIRKDWSFVVAHSLSTANKTRDALSKYNQRPQECREATRQIAEAVGGLKAERLCRLAPRLAKEEILRLSEKHLDSVLNRRVRHVLTEGDRVEAAKKALNASDLEAFGQLMNQSHLSMRDDFEITTPELDRLAAECLKGGAGGARMTGAGFGGCVVAVCLADRTQGLLEHLERTFYLNRPEISRFKEYLFVAEASRGAGLEP
ncbi:MAG: galactokinase [Acidobacteriota bacterium]|nr:MAG: galactokinase [Acidobacteriota bacterium]